MSRCACAFPADTHPLLPLSHLSFKNNQIESIKDVTIALKKCVNINDMSCK